MNNRSERKMAKLGNVKLRTLRDVAYESINEAIMKHELMPGETLTITNLAEKLGISPTPVREAVVRLSNEGILDYEANKRIKVSQIEREDVCEIYEARRLIEIYMSRKLVSAVKKNEGLKNKLEDLKKATLLLIETHQDPEQYMRIDLELNELFLNVIGNAVLKELFYIVGNKSLRIRTFVEAKNKSENTSGEALKPSAREHLEIIEALLSGSKDRVIKAMDLHLANSEIRTLKSLEEYFNTL
jgi:DNA-binding GntR family transcriptional regulator